MNKWDSRFMELAALVSTWSKDPDVKVGAAVRSDDNRVLSVGFNGFPADINDKPMWLEDKETKRMLTVHAEVNALVYMPKLELRSATLYVTRPPCVECAKFIVAHGMIGQVNCLSIPVDSNWHASCKKGEWLLAQANIPSYWW